MNISRKVAEATDDTTSRELQENTMFSGYAVLRGRLDSHDPNAAWSVLELGVERRTAAATWEGAQVATTSIKF